MVYKEYTVVYFLSRLRIYCKPENIASFYRLYSSSGLVIEYIVTSSVHKIYKIKTEYIVLFYFIIVVSKDLFNEN